MAKKIVIILVILVIIASLFLLQKPKEKSEIEMPKTEKLNQEFKPFNASFEIITNGTKRIFTDSKYHNRNPFVYIEKGNPNVIIVKKEDTKWSEFFDSLPSPMKLTKECLTTGTGQKFCTNKDRKLYFFLNGSEKPNVLDLFIKNEDYLLIEYK